MPKKNHYGPVFKEVEVNETRTTYSLGSADLATIVTKPGSVETRFAITGYRTRTHCNVAEAEKSLAETFGNGASALQGRVTTVNKIPVLSYVKPSKGAVMRSFGIGYDPAKHAGDEGVANDIRKMLERAVKPHIDYSNVLMQEEELVNELYAKYVELINREDMFFASKGKFFGLIKFAMTNEIKSIVNKMVYTEKRSGVTKEERREREDRMEREGTSEHTHPVLLSLDDPDAKLDEHVGNNECIRSDIEYREMLSKFMVNLTPQEQQVLNQELEPNEAALNLSHEQMPSCSKRFKVTMKRKAKGIGMNIVLYMQLLESVRSKFLVYKEQALND